MRNGGRGQIVGFMRGARTKANEGGHNQQQRRANEENATGHEEDHVSRKQDGRQRDMGGGARKGESVWWKELQRMMTFRANAAREE